MLLESEWAQDEGALRRPRRQMIGVGWLGRRPALCGVFAQALRLGVSVMGMAVDSAVQKSVWSRTVQTERGPGPFLELPQDPEYHRLQALIPFVLAHFQLMWWW